MQLCHADDLQIDADILQIDADILQIDADIKLCHADCHQIGKDSKNISHTTGILPSATKAMSASKTNENTFNNGHKCFLKK